MTDEQRAEIDKMAEVEERPDESSAGVNLNISTPQNIQLTDLMEAARPLLNDYIEGEVKKAEAIGRYSTTWVRWIGSIGLGIIAIAILLIVTGNAALASELITDVILAAGVFIGGLGLTGLLQRHRQ